MSEANYRDFVLSELEVCDYLRYDDKRVIGRRLPVLQAMEDEGIIVMRIVEVDEQESYLEVRLKGDK